jgi:hypothetical protein
MTNLLDFSNGVCEAQANYIYTLNTILVNIYCPPDAALAKFQDIINRVRSLLQSNEIVNPTIMITGDFNFRPDVVIWNKVEDVVVPTIAPGVSQTKLAFQALMNLADEYFLSQTMHVPTRLENTLDLYFTNDPQSIICIDSIVPQHISDHNLICIQTSYTTDTTEHITANSNAPQIAKFNYEKADEESFHKILKRILDPELASFNSLSPAEHKALLTTKGIESANKARVAKLDKTQKS